MRREARKETHGPNFDVVPIDHGVHTHELRPTCVCRVEMRQELAMRVRPACPQKYRLDCRPVSQVCLERRSHGQCVTL